MLENALWGRLQILPLLCLGAIPVATAAYAAGAISGTGTATIDGVLSPGEWDGAGRLDFQAGLPGGGTTPATFLVMNDPANLYLALRIQRPSFDAQGWVTFEFDSDRDGLFRENGDDWLRIDPPSYLRDGIRTTEPPCSGGGVCGFYDTTVGGTADGAGAAAYSGGYSTYELSHPLDSLDHNDWSLCAGMTIGAVMEFNLCSGCGSVYLGSAQIIRIAPTGGLAAAIAASYPGSYTAGRTMTVSLGLDNPGGLGAADFYFGLLFPDQDTIRFYSGPSFTEVLGSLSNPAGFTPIVAGIDLSNPFTLQLSEFFSTSWNAGDPPGRSILFLLATPPSALADGQIDADDILALAFDTVDFSP